MELKEILIGLANGKIFRRDNDYNNDYFFLDGDCLRWNSGDKLKTVLNSGKISEWKDPNQIEFSLLKPGDKFKFGENVPSSPKTLCVKLRGLQFICLENDPEYFKRPYDPNGAVPNCIVTKVDDKVFPT